MRIFELDLDTGDLIAIEPTLQQLTSIEDPVAVAKGRMLLDLVQYLRASGPEPRLVGQLFFDELDLWPLEEGISATVTIRPDWYDYGERDGDLPRMHYRVHVRPANQNLSQDIRTANLDQVAREIEEAFGWLL